MLFSIIIPTRNRADMLAATLYSISNVARINDAEVIVIDNGSTDTTKEVTSSFENKIPQIKYVYDEMPGLLSGRQRGINESRGEILIFLDDDVELSPGYLDGAGQAFSDPDIKLATGPSLPMFASYPPQWLEHFWTFSNEGRYCGWLSLLDFGNKAREINPNFVWGLNFVIRRTCVEELGGFHPDCIPANLQQFQGDGETGLTLKAEKLSYKALYQPEMLLYHKVTPERLTEAYFFKRAFYQGVCNSFTTLRKEHFNEPETIQKKEKSLLYQLRSSYHAIKNKFEKPKGSAIPPDVRALFSKLYEEEKKGYEFHQENFKTDTKVREWVLKNNYTNYNLPI